VTERLARTLAEMERADVDALVLGREGNARFVSGASRLALAGTRPFAPGCVVVRESGVVHLLSVTDEGVPPDIPPDRLYPLSWNPMNLIGAVVNAPGMNASRRIGVDGLTPLFEQLLATSLPDAALVDGEQLMRRVRQIKSDDDVDALRAAVNIVERALETAVGALHPGVRERDLVGVFEEARCSLGATVPAFQAAFCVSDRGRVRRFAGDQVIEEGDQVAIRVGALVDGWEGSLARTLTCGDLRRADGPRRTEWHSIWSEVRERIRPGTRVADLRGDGVSVHGVGLGYEGLADDDVLEPAMVVQAELERDGIVGADMFHIISGGAEKLTTALA
jgi:Xaa-Pro dipeptidase